jgi:hypothetical protein
VSGEIARARGPGFFCPGIHQLCFRNQNVFVIGTVSPMFEQTVFYEATGAIRTFDEPAPAARLFYDQMEIYSQEHSESIKQRG